MRIVVAGGAGTLGRRLCEDLTQAGHEPVVLTRQPRPGPLRQVSWDGRTVGDWARELEGAAVVNLAGELVDRRPTARNIELLERSRVEPTRALAEASRRLSSPVPVWLQASTLAIYGNAGEKELDESASPAAEPPQMAGVATAWERAAEEAHAERMVIMRTGIVLDADTPAMDRLVGITRWGLGGRVGPGTQWISWIHVDDWRAVMRALLHDTAIEGIVHVTGPEPVRNTQLMAALRRAVGRPAAPPTPAWLARVGAVFLRTDPALALTGRRALPSTLQQHGFEFSYWDIDAAIEDLVG